MPILQDIADALGVTEGAVSQWMSRVKKDGPDGLRHQLPPGPQPKLTDEQRAQLPDLLAKGSEHYGFHGEAWTTAWVACPVPGKMVLPHLSAQKLSRQVRENQPISGT